MLNQSHGVEVFKFLRRW